MRTLQQLAEEAVFVQNASNISGVASSFVRLLSDLKHILEAENNFSSDKLNQHPLVQAYVDKMSSLARIQNADFSVIMKAHNFCSELAAVAKKESEQ